MPSDAAAPPDASAPSATDTATEAEAASPASPAPEAAAAPRAGEGQPDSERKVWLLPAASKIDPADAPPPEPQDVDPDSVPYTHHQINISAHVGVRANWAPSPSIDPLAGKDVLLGPVLRVGFTPWASGRLSLGFTAEWGYANVLSATSRGNDTHLSTNRLGLGVEGRYHLNHRFYGYARVAPGVAFSNASYSDASSGYDLTSGNTAFRVDGTAGVAMRLAGSSDGRESGVRFLAYFEGGFDWIATTDLRLEMEEGGPRRTTPLDLGSLDLAGPHLGGGLMLTF